MDQRKLHVSSLEYRVTNTIELYNFSLLTALPLRNIKFIKTE